MDEWHEFVVEQRDYDLNVIIAEEKLKPEAIYQFVSRSFRDSKIVKDGMKITQKLSPYPYFHWQN